MPGSIRVFVNQRPVALPAGATALDAVRALDPGLAGRLADGTAALTDARGLPVDPASPVGAGSILRSVSRRAPEPDADP
ncbi:MAG TPA: hypothetical protein VJ773_04760 [Gemmatimonadales bacterium]|nr:hypothetical protein [Gemmatimonadales bacterium]